MLEDKSNLEKSTSLNRRRFMETGIAASAGTAGLFIVGTGGRFVAGKALEEVPRKWVQLGEIAELNTGQVHRVSYTVAQRDAWRRVEKQGLLYVTASEQGEYTVLDATCTHLGCTVKWQDETEQFRCPCHDAAFSREGALLDGPPPRPMRRLTTKIEEGVLWAEV